jgi:hypothetical protein
MSDLQPFVSYRARLLPIALLVALAVSAGAQPRPRAEEHEVKAAYLYQFGKYVEWPSDVLKSPFVICVLGRDPFGPVLDDTIEGKSISGERIEVKRVAGSGDFSACRILFVSHSEDDRLPAILKSLEGRVVLTVGEGPQFTRRGGMIAFVSAAQRVRFIVNLTAADAANVKLSSQLLRVAAAVDR